MKTAIIQCADTGPLESLVIMLRSVGYDCHLPNEDIKRELRALKCGLVLDIASLVNGMGYDWPMRLPEATLADMSRPDVVFVDVKAHQVYDKVTARWPNLKGRVLWYRINGAAPEHVIKPNGEDCGDEANPPCPVLTPNQWYNGDGDYSRLYTDQKCTRCGGSGEESPAELCQNCDHCWGWGKEPTPLHDFVLEQQRAYACWPPFYRFDEYFSRHDRPEFEFAPPVCLIHNVQGWGYGDLLEPMRNLGVKVFGAGSPDGLMGHKVIPPVLSNSLAMVHLKSSDAPGYSIYESLAAGCPIICTRRLIWRCKMQALLIPGETCLVFDRETHDGLTPEDVASCTAEVAGHLERLRDPAENQRIGMAGRQRLKEIMWSENRPSDVESLRAFMDKHYPN